MKRFASVLLAAVLMLSLSVFAFADSVPPIEQTPFFVEMEYHESDGIVPYSLIPFSSDVFYNSSEATGSSFFGELKSRASASFVDGVASGVCYSDYAFLYGPDYRYVTFGKQRSSTVTDSLYYWVNFIGKITDANGNVIDPALFTTKKMFITFVPNTSFTGQGGQAVGSVLPVLNGNYYIFDDGYIQFAFAGVNEHSMGSATLSLGSFTLSDFPEPYNFEIETFDFYSGEPSDVVPPFTFGDGAHSSTPPAPEVRDPNDASQYGSAQDQVQWYNDAFGGAVDPELDDKIVAGNEMLLQQEEIEQDVIADFQQYSNQVDPANITFPTAVLNGMSFIGSTFMSSYNNLGDISFVISLSMMIGVVLVLIGRGEGALARGMSASSRERRRTEYASERDMKKGG